jgi:hypothetical protein
MALSNSNSLNGRAFLKLLEEQRGTPSPGLLAFWAADWKDPLRCPKASLRIDRPIKDMLAAGRINLGREGIKPGLRSKGPYWFMRGGLIYCHKSAPPWLDTDREFDIQNRMKDVVPALRKVSGFFRFWDEVEGGGRAGIYDIQGDDLRLLSFEPVRLQRGRSVVIDPRGELARSIAGLTALVTDQLKKPPAGRAKHRPPNIWKKWFVQFIGQLWRDLTGEEPGVTPGSKFEDFVKAAWESLGSEMPAESFAKAIRDPGPDLLTMHITHSSR